MTALLERLEGASAGSDELSAYVIKHFRAPNGEVICSPINGKWCVYTAPGRLLENSSRDGWHRPEGWPVTEGIDAALALAERVIGGHIAVQLLADVLDANDDDLLAVSDIPRLLCAALIRATAKEAD